MMHVVIRILETFITHSHSGTVNRRAYASSTIDLSPSNLPQLLILFINHREAIIMIIQASYTLHLIMLVRCIGMSFEER